MGVGVGVEEEGCTCCCSVGLRTPEKRSSTSLPSIWARSEDGLDELDETNQDD